MSKYIHKPDGIDAMLALAGLTANWVPIKYHKDYRVMGTGCWHVCYSNSELPMMLRPLRITAHMVGDESFESWVEIIQKMCRKREERREQMKETRTWIQL